MRRLESLSVRGGIRVNGVSCQRATSLSYKSIDETNLLEIVMFALSKESKGFWNPTKVRIVTTRFPFVLLLMPIAMIAGCGGDTGTAAPPLASVIGVVSKSGKPVSNAIVEFFPTAGRSSVGKTNENGAYALKYSDDAGAVIGVCRVQITLGPPTAAAGGGDVVAPPMTAPPAIIKVPQEITVVDGENKFNFDLADFTVKG